MKKHPLIPVLLSLCLLLTACASSSAPVSSDPSRSTVTAEQYVSQNTVQEAMEAPANPYFHNGTAFTLTPSQFHARLESIGKAASPDFSARLVVTDWSVRSELQYCGETYMVVTYMRADSPDPYFPDAVNDPESAEVGRIDVMDYLDLDHAPDSFATVLTAFDATLTPEEIQEIKTALLEKHREYYTSDAVISKNGLGYGYSLAVNQLINSASFCIHPCDEVQLCQHRVESRYDVRGLPTDHCLDCDLYIFPPENWMPLTAATALSSSNESSVPSDICIGDWTDRNGQVYPNALKFWVVDRPNWSNTEYIEYQLDGSYTTFSAIIAAEQGSEANAQMWINFYLDGQIIYSSGLIGGNVTEGVRFPIGDARTIRIECVTNMDAQGHCIVSAALF